MKELSSLPHDLDKTYVRIIHQINQQPEALQVLAQKCLIWVVHAVRPLQTEELIDAVAVEDSSTMRSDLHRYPKEVILEVCANLLVEENQFIRPIHYSVQEYFTKPPKGVIDSHCSKYFTAFEHAQAQLAKSCLLYLMLDFLAKGPCQDSSDLQERLLNYPFAWYSSQFFDKHIQCLGEVTGDILERLNMFLSSTGNTLSAVLQLRRLRNGHDPIIVTKDFDPFSWPINAATVIYATALYDLPCLHREDSKWMKLKVPKYTLHLASSGGSLDAVNRLLELGHSIHDQDESGATPLYYASANGHERIVRPLLDGGAEINAQGGRFGTALQAASIRGHDQIVKLLLKNGAQVNLRVGRYGNALQAASVDGHNRIVQRLLDNGAEINDQGGRYGNALQAASANGYDEIVQLLLKKGADVNAEGGRYGNALQAASFAGHNQIVEQLLTKGANVKAHGGRYGYALQAASRYGYVQVVQVLIESGADVNAQGGQFGNALQAASRYGHEKVIQLLLKNGALNSADQSQ
jgi:ankyrin repeat protein